MDQKTLERLRQIETMEERRLTRIVYKSYLEISRDRERLYFGWLEGYESARNAKPVELRNAKANWMKG